MAFPFAFAGSSITYSTTGYRQMTMDYLEDSFLQYEFAFTSIAKNGYNTWANSVNLSTTMAEYPDMLVFDTTNDTLYDADWVNAYREAFIRKIWTTKPSCRIAWMNFFQVSDIDIDDPTALNQTDITSMKALCAHYDIPVVDYQAEIVRLVSGGAHLNTYFSDQTHPTLAGHTVATNLLKAQIPSGGKSVAVLPARLYASSENYENTPIRVSGSDETSKTGTWTDDGTSISSSTSDSTITFTATCQSYGVYRADGETNGTVAVSIDSGAYGSNFVINQNGYEIAGARALHTITIKVVSGTLKIDEFWAI